jgi:hypothetical protein
MAGAGIEPSLDAVEARGLEFARQEGDEALRPPDGILGPGEDVDGQGLGRAGEGRRRAV